MDIFHIYDGEKKLFQMSDSIFYYVHYKILIVINYQTFFIVQWLKTYLHNAIYQIWLILNQRIGGVITKRWA